MEAQVDPQKRQSVEPTCSICIANYNGVGIINDCIDAVLGQNVDFPYEIIVHDDASTDESAEYIKDRYPNVRLIESQENVGFCISNNRMAALARGRYILLLNNDAALFPDALQTLYNEATGHAAPAILGLPQYDAETGRLIDIGSLCDPFLNPIPNQDKARSDVAMVSGACLWLPIELWQALGGFPEWFHTLAEDMYLCCVARLWGYSVRAIPHSGFYHWVGKSIGGGKVIASGRLATSRKRRALSERNKTFVIFLCYPALQLLLVLPLHLLFLSIEGAILALIKRDFGIWKTIYFPLLPALWRSRKTLISMRRMTQSHKCKTARATTFFKPFSVMPYKLVLLLKYGLPTIR